MVPLSPEAQSSRQKLDAALVVCIDNEPEILAGMRTLLTGWGCRVIAARAAQDAIATLSDAPTGEVFSARPQVPAIIVADYHLDDATGVDAILAIRRHVNADVPGIIVTADHSPEVQRQLRQLEFTLLRKPLKAAALRAVLMQSMRRMAAE